MEKTRAAAPLAPSVFFYFILLLLLIFFSTADGQRGPPIVIPSPSVLCPPEVAKSVSTLPFQFKFSSPKCTIPNPLSLVFAFEQGQTDKSRWSFMLIIEDYEGYISVGWSPDGSMIGSSAIAGWISSSGVGVVKSYLLGGYNSTACVPGTGSLPLVPGSASIVSAAKFLILGFQLNITGDPNPHIIFAVGPPKRLPGPDFLLPLHYARTSSLITF